MEGAPVVVHGDQSPHFVNDGQIIQKLEVLSGSPLGVSTVGRSPHQRIKFVVVGWVRIVQAFRDERREQSAAEQPAAQVGCGRITFFCVFGMFREPSREATRGHRTIQLLCRLYKTAVDGRSI